MTHGGTKSQLYIRPLTLETPFVNVKPVWFYLCRAQYVHVGMQLTSPYHGVRVRQMGQLSSGFILRQIPLSLFIDV